MRTTETGKFTAADYERLPEGFPAELLEGMLVKEPSPTGWHQRLVGRILYHLHGIVGPDRALPAPVDVFVDDYNVLQPDVLVLARQDRVEPGTGRVALPIVVFEVLSPATAEVDRGRKAGAYLRAGVREVWLVDPDSRTIELRTSEGAARFGAADRAESGVVPGLSIAFRELES